MTYVDLGDPWPDLSVTVRDSAGALANATTVKLTLTAPDRTKPVNELVVAPSSTGVYEHAFVPTQRGLWVAEWVATGSNASAFTDTLTVAAAWNAPVSLREAKAHLNIPAASTADDEELRATIDAVTAWIEHRVGPVAQRTVTETVWPQGGALFLQAPVVSLTSVTAAHGWDTVYDVDLLYVDGEAGIAQYGATAGSALTHYPVTVTYVAGRTDVPAGIRYAALTLVKALWETQRGSGGVPQFQGSVDEAVELPGVGLAIWRAERLLEPHLLAPSVA